MVDPRHSALNYLQQCNVMTLATNGPHGLWAAAVFYASVEFDLFFLSAGHTRHARNLAANPRTAATIQKDYAGWQEIRGIQLEGDVSRLSGGDRESAIELYTAKFPFVAQPGSTLYQALMRMEWYCLSPSLLYYIDNSLGLGHRDEIALKAS